MSKHTTVVHSVETFPPWLVCMTSSGSVGSCSPFALQTTCSTATSLKYWMPFCMVIHFPEWHIPSWKSTYLSCLIEVASSSWGLVLVFQCPCHYPLPYTGISHAWFSYRLVLNYCFHYPRSGAARWQWGCLDGGSNSFVCPAFLHRMKIKWLLLIFSFIPVMMPIHPHPLQKSFSVYFLSVQQQLIPAETGSLAQLQCLLLESEYLQCLCFRPSDFLLPLSFSDEKGSTGRDQDPTNQWFVSCELLGWQ